ncbi:hypothetical protein [Coleofasciculus sp. G2-EDA-02]|uniref:hypothetical protein n=1 Tax=Coleofasciculus sp. G2-EDA-02 TaxID=3069529 RepID=UPI0032F4263F
MYDNYTKIAILLLVIGIKINFLTDKPIQTEQIIFSDLQFINTQTPTIYIANNYVNTGGYIMNRAIQLQQVFIPGGIADTTGKFGCIQNEEGGTDCIDLTNGHLISRINRISKPLLIRDQKLIIWSPNLENHNVLHLFTALIQKGQESLRPMQSVSLPEWCDATSTDSLDFQLQASAEDNQLVIQWQARSRYKGGAPPPQYIIEQLSKDAAGTVRIDINTGKIISRNFQEITPEKNILQDDFELFARTIPYKQGFEWYNKPWTVGEHEFVLLSENAKGQPGIYLLKRDAINRREQNITKLLEKSAISSEIELNLTPDGRYLFAVLADSDSAEKSQSSWYIFSVTSGERVSVISYEPGTEYISVIDGKIFYLVEQFTPQGEQTHWCKILKSRDLRTGKIVWFRTLIDRYEKSDYFSPPPLPL